MPDLTGVWLKVDRAREHIDTLDAEIRAMFATEPLRVVSHVDEQAQEKKWVVEYAEGFRLPPRLALLAGDAAHDLRSALDHLAFAAAGKRADDRTTAFPIWRHPNPPGAKRWKDAVRTKLQGASRQFEQAISARQAWEGGSDAFLWEVDHLDVTDKHKTLLLVIMSNEVVRPDFGKAMGHRFWNVPEGAELPSMKLGIVPADRLVTDGTVLFHVPWATTTGTAPSSTLPSAWRRHCWGGTNRS